MPIDIELLLARHPLLFFRWEGRVELGYCGFIIAAVGGGGRYIHPLSAVKRARNKLCNEQGGREVAWGNKADILDRKSVV